MKMNPVVHFEMPAQDRKRMSDFYTKAFGWKAIQMGPEMGHYVMVHTTETDDKGMIEKKNCINGGFFEKTPEMGEVHPSVVISVEDIKAHIKIVEAAGGKVLGEPMEIPGVGWYAGFIDTEGNQVSMLQPKEMI